MNRFVQRIFDKMIDKSWQPLFDQYDFDLDDIYQGIVYPPKEKVFRVFQLPVHQIKVVLLGQDPYHGPGQADGLSFSVPVGQSIPPSLLNIFKELQRSFPDRNYKFSSGSLEEWLRREKIFLCNASLTVEQGKAGSHMDIWKDFTDDVIQYIDKHNKSCVFLLLGNFAKAKSSLISKKDRIVTEAHPSPLAAAHGFVGSNVFQRVEKVLGQKINWSIQPCEDDLCNQMKRMELAETEIDTEIDTEMETVCQQFQKVCLEKPNPYKKVIYVDCDPKVFGTNKFPITIDSTPPQATPEQPRKKQTRLEKMCEDPQTKGEEAVQIYVEYCKANNLPIKIEDINDILATT